MLSRGLNGVTLIPRGRYFKMDKFRKISIFGNFDRKIYFWNTYSYVGTGPITLNAGQGGSVTGRGLRLAKSGVVLRIDNWRDKSSYRAPVPECEVTSHYSHTRCAIGF